MYERNIRENSWWCTQNNHTKCGGKVAVNKNVVTGSPLVAFKEENFDYSRCRCKCHL
jgi:hypothetical protein